ncbi:MAG TPA: hypothetical protein ENJ82_05690 [Bacteroidetes bacterium]|nr:hypothetical protein [Bacteroidota bacterium]
MNLKWVLLLLPLLFLGVAEIEFETLAPKVADLPSERIAYDFRADSLVYDSLKRAFGKHKELPKGYELAALRALSHYPELAEVPVAFVYRKNPVAHSSRPRNGSLFLGKRHRKYLVIISTDLKPVLEPGKLGNLTYNAQIGVLGHELAHTVDYLQRGFFNIIGLGIRYATNKKLVKRWERLTDKRAIGHNLGYQLLAWSREVHSVLEAAGRGQNYLTPAEIELEMQSRRL